MHEAISAFVSLCEHIPIALTLTKASLRAVLKPKNMSSSAQANPLQTLFGSLFSLVSIVVRIYFNRLQNTGTLELNYFVFEKHVIERTSNTNTRMLRLCAHSKYFLLPPSVSVAVWITVFACFDRLLYLKLFYVLPFLASMSRAQWPFDSPFFSNIFVLKHFKFIRTRTEDFVFV